uniref:Glutathione S-transferase 1-like n=1 Tax=Diabrotica virgifera virgifera TaxID=50390 RepID=A0A6P7GSC2_DIAVI
MAPKLYGDSRSPCVRAVLLAAEAMKIKLEYVAIDVVKKEHLTDEYLKVSTLFGFFLYKRQPNFPQDLAEALDKAYGFLETFLTESKYVAGDEMTIADFSLWTSTSNSNSFVPIDAAKYPKVTAWSKKMGELPYSHLNFEGYQEFKKLLEILKAQLKAQ